MRAMNVCVTRARGSVERKQHGQRSGTLRRVFMRGKNVRGVAPEPVHARYAAEVCELREELTRRAGECGVSVPEWHELSADAAMQRIAKLLVTL